MENREGSAKFSMKRSFSSDPETKTRKKEPRRFLSLRSRSSSEKDTVAESRDDGVNAGSSTTSEMVRKVLAERGDGVNAGSSAVAGESRDDDDKTEHLPLYRALVKGDLGGMKAYLDEHGDAISAKISTRGETPLHIAISHGHHKLAMELLHRIGRDEEKLSKKDDYGDTPLHIAARGANTLIADTLAVSSETLMGLGDADGQVPLTLAAIYGNRDMLSTLGTKRLHDAIRGDRNKLWTLGSKRWSDAHYASSPTDFDYSEENKWTLFNELILSKQFELALYVWEKEQPELMTFKDDLYRMAEMVAVFSSANQFTNYERWIQKFLEVLDSAVCWCPLVCASIDASPRSPRPIFERVKFIYSMVLNILVGLMLCVAIVPAFVLALIGMAVAIILKFDMKEENENACKLLGFMCSPKWTFDSKHFEVYFEAIKRAIKCGNVEFVEEVLRSYPALLWGNKENGTIFHIALTFRQEKIWNLIYGLSVEQRNKVIGIRIERNNMLHIAACPMITAKTIGVPGAAMKVQRELQWFKEVEGMVPSSYRIRPNGNGNTPDDLFTTRHSKLVKDGEKWMRGTATSCTIVATLIVTVMFAAAFTLPGGNYDQSENSGNPKSAQAGNPRFLWRNSFMVFVISDALSLFSSVTAVLMFLSILTSRFEEKDFLKALPKRLIIGLATLFLSIASMMVTFGVTLVIVFSERIRWTIVPVIVLASFPVTLFVLLQFPLFVDMALSTYGGIFNRKKKCSFFNNPNDYFPGKKTNNNVDDPANQSEV